MTDPYFDERNNWLRLEKELADRDLALIVGAGISYASGFPTWPEMVRMLATNAKIAYKVLSKINASPPAQLAIIRQTYGNEDDRWVEAVRSVLYDGFRQKCKGQVAIPELPNKYSDDDFAWS